MFSCEVRWVRCLVRFWRGFVVVDGGVDGAGFGLVGVLVVLMVLVVFWMVAGYQYQLHLD